MITVYGRVEELDHLTLGSINALRELVRGYGTPVNVDLERGKLDFHFEADGADFQLEGLAAEIASAKGDKDYVAEMKDVAYALETWAELQTEVQAQGAKLSIRWVQR